MEKFSLPQAALYLKKQTASELQFVNRESGEVISFSESFLERAENLGEYSAYRTYTTEELKKISDASSVMENPEKFVALPRVDTLESELGEKKLMTAFAEEQPRENEAALKKSLGGIFGSAGKFEKTLKKLGLEQDFADFERSAYEKQIIIWADKNGLEYTALMPEMPESGDEENFELDEDFSPDGENFPPDNDGNE